MTHAPLWMLCVALLLASGPAQAQVFEPTDEAIEAPAEALPEDATSRRIQYDTYRTLSGAEYDRLQRETGFDGGELLDCVAEEEPGRRERMVTRVLLYSLFVEQDGTFRIEYRGDEENDADPDDDQSVQECIEEKLAEQQEGEDATMEPAPEEFRGGRYTWTWYSDNYHSQRIKRHGEIIGLYTLSGVSLGVGIGALVAAGNEGDRSDQDIQSEEVQQAESGRSREQRFRRAGWTMIGVSTVAFIGADILLVRNRRIERDENPWWASTAPVGPQGSLGFSYATRF